MALADNRLCRTKLNQTSHVTVMTYKKQTVLSCPALKVKLLCIWKMSQHIKPDNHELDQESSNFTCLSVM